MARGIQKCSICTHPERIRIEALKAGGASFDALANKFEVDRSAIWRHWHQHVAAELKVQYLAGPATIEELRNRAAEENMTLLDYLGIVRSILMGQLTASAEAGGAFVVSTVAARLLDVLREIGRLTGEISRLNPSITINNNVAVLNSPVIVDMQAALLRALQPYPDARRAVIQAMRELEHQHAAGPKLVEAEVQVA